MTAGRLALFRRSLAIAAVAVVSLVMLAPAALASLSQGYASTAPIAAGTMVSLDDKSPGSVNVADLTNSERLFGVAVTPSSASVSLGGTGSSGQVQVVTTGSATTFVSTAGGDIRVGDPIAISPIAGVGQKADGKVRVIGTSQADFTSASTGTTKRTIDDGTGKKEVTIGQIPVVVAVSTYNSNTGTQDYSIPTWMQNLSNSIAGKTVSPVRVIIAGLILLVSLVSVTVLLYSAVRNSIISIGRNPLSRGSVLRSLFQVILVAAVILAIAVGAMYLVISR